MSQAYLPNVSTVLFAWSSFQDKPVFFCLEAPSFGTSTEPATMSISRRSAAQQGVFLKGGTRTRSQAHFSTVLVAVGISGKNNYQLDRLQH